MTRTTKIHGRILTAPLQALQRLGSWIFRPVFDWFFEKVCSWLIYESPLNAPLTDFDELRHELKPGDVVLVEGRSRVARIIQHLTTSRWTHAVLFLGRLEDIENDKLKAVVLRHFDRKNCTKRNPQLIIESELGIGTVVRPLAEYQGEHLRICRPEGLVPP